MDEASSLDQEPYSVSITVRPFDEQQDQAFIYSTWRNSQFYGNKEAHTESPKVVFKEMTKEIKHILKKATVKVACLDYDPRIIVGYVVYTDAHLDWVYIKEDYRRVGIASMLIPKTIKSVTNKPTKIGKSILEKKLKENADAQMAQERPAR